jgi:hypothetical protein
MTKPETYVSKPSEIEAMQWTGTSESVLAITGWVGRISTGEFQDTHGFIAYTEPTPSAVLYVAANDGWLDLEVSEWVAKDDHGFYPIKDDVFCRKYEPKNLIENPLRQAIAAVEARNHPPKPIVMPDYQEYFPTNDEHH